MQNSIQGMIQFFKCVLMKKYKDTITLDQQSFTARFRGLIKSCEIVHTIWFKISFMDNTPKKITQNVENLTLQSYFQVAKGSVHLNLLRTVK